MSRWLVGLSGLFIGLMLINAAYAKADDTFPMLTDTDSLPPDRVLILVAEIENCSYCLRVKNEFLLPLTKDPKWEPLFSVRRLDLNSPQIVNNFARQSISQKALGITLGADFSPTLMFLNPVTGQRIGEDIIGLVTPDFYGFYLQQQIVLAYGRLTQKK